MSEQHDSIINAKYSWNGREVNFQEFILLQVETGSKAKWFNCPLAWQINSRTIEAKHNKTIEELQEESWEMLKNGDTDKALVFPVGMFKCSFCQFGHMTECHYPNDCDSGFCDHYSDEEEY